MRACIQVICDCGWLLEDVAGQVDLLICANPVCPQRITPLRLEVTVNEEKLSVC